MQSTSNSDTTGAFPTQTFRVGELFVDPRTGEVSRRLSDQEPVATLPHKAVAVLVTLARTPGELVTKQTLFAQVWQDRAVTDDVLTVAVYRLRKVFDDSARNPRYVQTFPGSGYRLIADVDWAPVVEAPRIESPAQPVRLPVIALRRPRWLSRVAGVAVAVVVTAFTLAAVASIEDVEIRLDPEELEGAASPQYFGRPRFLEEPVPLRTCRVPLAPCVGDGLRPLDSHI